MKSMQDPDRSDAPASGARRCPACGREFVCGMAAGQSHCWCADLPPIKLSEPEPAGCYCPDCLRALA